MNEKTQLKNDIKKYPERHFKQNYTKKKIPDACQHQPHSRKTTRRLPTPPAKRPPKQCTRKNKMGKIEIKMKNIC